MKTKILKCGILGVCLAQSGCLFLFAHQSGYSTPEVPGVRIIKAEQADKKLASESMSIPVHQNQNGTDGTRSILDFLKEAQKRGARQVSNITISLIHQKANTWTRCTTQVVTFVVTNTAHVQQKRPGTGITKSEQVLRPVTRTVTEYQYRCHWVSRPVTRTETYYAYEYDYYSKRSRSVPKTRTVTRYESKNECRNEPVTRTVTRYEYQWVSRYVPTQWEYVAMHYSNWQLKETEPVCVLLEASEVPENKSQAGWITGTLHLVHAGETSEK